MSIPMPHIDPKVAGCIVQNFPALQVCANSLMSSDPKSTDNKCLDALDGISPADMKTQTQKAIECIRTAGISDQVASAQVIEYHKKIQGALDQYAAYNAQMGKFLGHASGLYKAAAEAANEEYKLTGANRIDASDVVSKYNAAITAVCAGAGTAGMSTLVKIALVVMAAIILFFVVRMAL